MSLAQPPEVGSAAETAAAARAGHRSTLPLAAERIPLRYSIKTMFVKTRDAKIPGFSICLGPGIF